MVYRVFIGAFLIFSSCNYDWTDEEREKFRTECSSQVYFDIGAVGFIGFDFDEVDSIQVIEKQGIAVLDTIIFQLDDKKDGDKYWARTNNKLSINNSYEFLLDNDSPYILANMEMIMWAQYTMTSEGWGCEMGNFTIDDIEYKKIANVCIQKRIKE